MPATTPFDLANLAFSGKKQPEEVVRIAQRVGVDYLEVAALVDVELTGDLADLRVTTREELEAKERASYSVTARGVPRDDAKGKAYKYVFAGRHKWVRTHNPDEATTHALTPNQYKDVIRKSKKGSLIIVDQTRIEPEPKVEEPKSEPKVEEPKSEPKASRRG